MIYTHGMN